MDSFCTTTQADGINLDGSNDYSYGFDPVPYTPNERPALKARYSTYYVFNVFVDPREECGDVRLFGAPVVEPVLPTGPYVGCWDPLQQLVNGCNAAAGLDKWGGTIERDCVIYGFQAWVGPTIGGTGDRPPIEPCGVDRKRDCG